ncbi:Tetratricopeptide repeat protein 30A [Batrachochytrium dendrobatidis]|nr:Tetratricopeptide repeat protein 30A [Batrachochytrium dendrobatidis]KAK5670251.1 Tetratricopeptide repeat protein 30A [Batrachochytrium dendrobatidis]
MASVTAARMSTAVPQTGMKQTPVSFSITPTSFQQIPEGKYTATVYSFIRDGRFHDVIKILSNEIQVSPKSRAALSLLAYCHYHVQDFHAASDCYEQLIRLFPDAVDYRLFYAQSLFKSANYPAAQKACQSIDAPQLAGKLLKLQAAIKYEMDDLSGCKAFVDQAPQDDPDTLVNQACLLFKELKYEEACIKYTEASKIVGYNAEILYNIALCHYMIKQYVHALKHIAEIIEKGIREHPELGVGMATEGIDLRSVGNSQMLHETYLVEVFNLKAAIEYHLKNYEGAREALTDMPPRQEHELDHVTLHNQALMNMDENPSIGFEKLGFLLQQVPCPPETFGNLLLLYIKYEYVDSAADLLADNSHLAASHLSPYLYDFLEATLLKHTAPEEAYKKFDDLANKHIDVLRKLTKKVQEARQNHDDEVVKQIVTDYDEAVDRYIPILMAQAKIYWEMDTYNMVEKIFRKSVEFCNEHDVWKLNVAHVLFMQESKYKEAISFYEPIVKKNYDNILDVTAIVLANLCVSYIMTSQNEEAEDLMRRIEKEEERVAYEDPNKRTYHLCIVNLVIGTLYCAKGNYEFGISRIMKSLEPFNKKLGTDTWFYAKRCFVSLFETLAKHMIILRDTVFQEILEFFDTCETHGRYIPVVIDPLSPDANQSPTGHRLLDEDMPPFDSTHNTVSSEARLLKSLFLRLYD